MAVAAPLAEEFVGSKTARVGAVEAVVGRRVGAGLAAALVVVVGGGGIAAAKGELDIVAVVRVGFGVAVAGFVERIVVVERPG